MELLNDIRFWTGVLVLSVWLPAIGCWLVIHPIIGFWRRAGFAVMWSMVAVIGLSGAFALFWFRDLLMGQDLGLSYLAAIVGSVLFVIGFYLDWERRKTLTTRILVGTPEFENDASELLTTGPYARVRHPRYLAIFVSYLGMVMFANHTGLYIYYGLGAPLLYLIMVVEERELRARFGKAYDDYAAKTPMIIPRFF